MDYHTSGLTSGGGEFMLFGVRVVVDSMRKSVSLNNLSEYQHRLDVDKNLAGNLAGDIAVGYVSADDAVHHSSSTATTITAVNGERKRGVPWTEEEHKLFLLGLQKVGKGDWRGISRNFVKTRTPTQVASHAQKYFIRRSNLNRRRRRSSLFDITTDSVVADLNNDQSQQEEVASTSIQANPEKSNVEFTISSTPIYNTLSPQVIATPASRNKSMVEFDLNSNTDMNTSMSTSTSVLSFDPSPMSLDLSLSLSTGLAKATSSMNSAFQAAGQRFGNPDGWISVA